jgi:hypothetical protein
VSRVHPDDGAAPDGCTPIDLLLEQGTPSDRVALRRRIGADPMLTLEMAETVALVEGLRQLTCEPSERFGGKLSHVVRQAERRLAARQRPSPWLPLVGFAAAAATLLLLWWWDPLAPRSSSEGHAFARLAAAPETRGVASPTVVREVRDAAELAWEAQVARMRQRIEFEQAPHLGAAFEVGLQDIADPLAQWVEPRNALARLRIDHELRGQPEVRRAALRAPGGLAAVDDRVQRLADALAPELAALAAEPGSTRTRAATATTLGLGLRALLAAGPSTERRPAVEASLGWLVAELPDLHGEPLAWALGALIDAVAVSDAPLALLPLHGQRLLDEVLVPGQDSWASALPPLIGSRASAAALGEAGRVLGHLPAFGLEPWRCRLVHQLVVGQLRERRSGSGQERPEVLAAIVYGCAALLTEVERDRVENDLRRWKPIHLAPDFVTVQQIAWGIRPGQRGFARLQGELRQLALLPAPEALAARAGFCLCLATNYAGLGSGNLQRVAAGL